MSGITNQGMFWKSRKASVKEGGISSQGRVAGQKDRRRVLTDTHCSEQLGSHMWSLGNGALIDTRVQEFER